jgi:hypothetical protein
MKVAMQIDQQRGFNLTKPREYFENPVPEGAAC